MSEHPYRSERDGRAAYARYSKAVGGKIFDGRDMPTWDALGETQKRGWMAAGEGDGQARLFSGMLEHVAAVSRTQADEAAKRGLSLMEEAG